MDHHIKQRLKIEYERSHFKYNQHVFLHCSLGFLLIASILAWVVFIVPNINNPQIYYELYFYMILSLVSVSFYYFNLHLEKKLVKQLDVY